MDSITQITLGAAVGEAVLGKHIGSRAILWGGIFGLFPDLDVLIPFGDAVKDFTYHRGFSHSLFVLTALTPIFVWLVMKVHPSTAQYRNRWFSLVFLALITHVLLDCLTVYGTQILWPLATPPVMWSTIFIIDPIYSLPLVGGVLTALVYSRKRSRGHMVNAICLALTTLYLAWSVGAKLHVDSIVKQSLSGQGIAYERFLTVPAPFNTVLWRVVVMDDEGYYEGFYSLLDHNKTIGFTHYPSKANLLETIEDHWPVKRLQWFTHGFYSVRELNETVVISDLRMGLEPYYVFQFIVGAIGNPHPVPIPNSRIRTERGIEMLSWVWKRMWGQLHPQDQSI